MGIWARIRRHGAGLLALGAVAVLAAGCDAGPTLSGPDDPDGGAKGSEVQARGEDGASDPTLPEGWHGTVSAERFAPEDDTAYLAMLILHGAPDAEVMSAEQIEGSEFLAGTEADCEGSAELDGSAATCTFTAISGSDAMQTAQVRLVPTGFDGAALLFGVSGAGAPELSVVPGADHALQTILEDDISQVTDESLAADVTSAVMMGHSHDSELPAELTADCAVIDGGEHGQCEVTGTPDGAADGTWYATAQSGYGEDRTAYLFTRLPPG